MARLTGIVALLAVALLVADAYAYHTTVTTVEVDEDIQGRQQRCQDMSAREELRNCDEYLKMQSRTLRMRGIDNPKRPEESFVACCIELRNVDEQCRCDMIEEIAKEEQSQARRQERKQMPPMAKYLPAMCGLSSQPCRF